MMIDVTQEDREAAADLWLKNEGEPYSLHDKATVAEIQMGNRDDWDCVQAFAAHRIASTAALAERVRVLEEALRPFADAMDVHEEVGKPYPDDDRINIVQAYGCLLAELDESYFIAARKALEQQHDR